ncbi:MAG: NCS2 family permease [Oscillospiraceae bacterium]|nr:NCS2 family permease [Oscillospiraceae bacterium]
MEKLFRLKEHGTDVRTEVTAGLTTFMTMAYILAVNPSVLSDAGMDPTAVLLATCLASFIGTICMALFANLPFALSAGMGLNAYFAYTVCISYGYSWQTALLAVFVEGVIFILLSVTKVREAIFNAFPMELKKAISVGIGLFIAFNGLQNAGLAQDDPATLVTLVTFRENFSTVGICALLALIGVLLTAVLHIRNVKGSILIGILGTWMLGMILQLCGVYVPDGKDYLTLFPTLKMTDFSALGNTFGQCFHVDLSEVGIFNFIMVVCSFLFVDLFDTIGTLIGVSDKAGLLDKDGKLPQIRPALFADAIATTAGSVFGTSTVSTFVESASGVGAGGRTGLTSLTTALLFLVSMLLAPIFVAVPAFATAPALILVGFLMFSSITEIRFSGEHMLSAIPAYLCVIAMPLFYSISEGIAIGVISYVVIHLACGKYKQITPVMYVLAVLFVAKYIFL